MTCSDGPFEMRDAAMGNALDPGTPVTRGCIRKMAQKKPQKYHHETDTYTAHTHTYSSPRTVSKEMAQKQPQKRHNKTDTHIQYTTHTQH